MITNDYEPEELQFVLPEVVKDTFPLELTFGNAETRRRSSRLSTSISMSCSRRMNWQ